VRQVFISHSSADKPLADKVVTNLEDNGIPCWIAPRDIPAGANYAGEISKGIRECPVLLLVYSENSNSSDAVKREVEIAFNEKRTIIPLRIHDIPPCDELNFFLAGVQWWDVSPDWLAIGELIHDIGRVLNVKVADTPPITPIAVSPPPPEKKRRSVGKTIFKTVAGLILIGAIATAAYFIVQNNLLPDQLDFIPVGRTVEPQADSYEHYEQYEALIVYLDDLEIPDDGEIEPYVPEVPPEIPEEPDAPEIESRPLMEVAPWFERGSNRISTGNITLRGEAFSGAITVTHHTDTWSHHNLDERFSTFTAIVGKIDDSGTAPRAVRILGDGTELFSAIITEDIEPTEISLDVAGVSTLRIEADARTAGVNDPVVGVAFADAALQLVYGVSPTPTPRPPVLLDGRPLMEVAPWFERANNRIGTNNVTMRGQSFSGAISVTHHTETWSHHNLDDRFTTISGVIGRVDGTGVAPRTVRFMSDDEELFSFLVTENTPPTDFLINVTGVTTLRIDVGARATGIREAAVGIAIADAVIE